MTTYAKLVRGRTYYLGNKLFERGKSVMVTADEQAILEDPEKGAYDRVTVEGRVELFPKFDFVESEKPLDEPEEKKPTPRIRSRKPAQD